MEDIRKYSEHALRGQSYRVLQQIAKSMALPSNVKKVYLVELIYAKTHKTSVEVEAIVQKVRYERQMLSQANISKRKKRKKMRLQAMEVSSSNTCMSPPIDLTPKRNIAPYSPELTHQRPVIKYQPRVFSPKNTSDRVLRSYNVKSYRRPNYSLLDNSVVELELVKGSEGSCSREKETQIRIVSHEGRQQRLNVTARCMMRKYRPIVCSPRSYLRIDKPITSATASTQTQSTSKALVPAKRVRRLSGISALPPPEPPLNTNYEYIQSIGFRRTDGKISKINALVQKPAPMIAYNQDFDAANNYRNVEVTIQDIINSNIDAQTFTNPNVSEYTLTDSTMTRYQMPLTDVMPNQKIVQSTNEMNSFSVYYHKKIRAEQVRSKRNSMYQEPSIPVARNEANEQRLPKISDVFSNMKTDAPRDVTRPLYLQLYDDQQPTEDVQPYPPYRNNSLLEPLYNLKNIHAQPLVQIATTATTRCVYSSATISTAVLQPPATPEPYHAPMYEPVSQSQYATYGGTSDEVSRLCDLSTFGEQDITLRSYHEALSSSSVESHDIVTIPEMVEDALELISQDGDYMERINMDVRMQCILCSWAGSKIVLEYHIRKEHASEISQQDKDEWNITYKLGSLVNQPQWLSHVCERDSTLYVLSVRYEDPDCFMASLSTLTSLSDSKRSKPKLGTITLYNKVSGEPHTWHGPIPQLATNMPYENDPNCLRIELSKLELLPNSANIILHNRALVANSPSKVVVGQPALNDIHIIIFVKIQDQNV